MAFKGVADDIGWKHTSLYPVVDVTLKMFCRVVSTGKRCCVRQAGACRKRDAMNDGSASPASGQPVKQSIAYVSLVVDDYDDAIQFYVGTLGFTLVEDTYIKTQDKRWVVVAPVGSSGTKLVLARAVGPEQRSRVGNQTGGRVFLFLHTDDFWRDYEQLKSRGVVFVREPKRETYGTVAVFRDLYGNLWDLLEPES
jgi:catechol 2,3-dioxygenase-like lactoylglutathione lyase family enzyme